MSTVFENIVKVIKDFSDEEVKMESIIVSLIPSFLDILQMLYDCENLFRIRFSDEDISSFVKNGPIVVETTTIAVLVNLIKKKKENMWHEFMWRKIFLLFL